MKSRALSLVFAGVSLCSCALAEDQPAPAPTMSDLLRARIAAEARKQAANPPPVPAKAPAPAATPTEKPSPVGTPSAPVAAPTAAVPKEPEHEAAADAAKAAKETPTVLPKVEVKRDKITVLDVQLAEQEKEIAREKKGTQQTELDKALNDSKVSKAMSIFGGESSEYRAGIAKERVSLMEEEKDLTEAIAHAKTKEEKASLQKQLDELRAYRRELEKSLR
jgi:hypothetical protein